MQTENLFSNKCFTHFFFFDKFLTLPQTDKIFNFLEGISDEPFQDVHVF